jgi:hypothetical protein
MDTGDDSQSYFSAARKGGLSDQLEELKLMQQQLIANRANGGSPSRGPLLQQQPIIPTTGAAPYMYVDPNAGQGQDAQQLRDLQLLKQFQLLPSNTPNILMNTKALPRFAGERDDLLRDTEDTFYGGGHGQPRPTPKPTPQPTKYFPVSYFA